MTKNFILAWRWLGLPRWHRLKNLPANAGNARDLGLITGSGRSPEVGNGNPFQYSCLGNPMDRGDCWAIVDGIAESRTQLSACACRNTHTHTHTHTHGVRGGPSLITCPFHTSYCSAKVFFLGDKPCCTKERSVAASQSFYGTGGDI